MIDRVLLPGRMEQQDKRNQLASNLFYNLSEKVRRFFSRRSGYQPIACGHVKNYSSDRGAWT